MPIQMPEGQPQQMAEACDTLHRWNRPLPSLDGGSVEIPWLDADATHHVITLADAADRLLADPRVRAAYLGE